jgi:molecular chaperone GrpE
MTDDERRLPIKVKVVDKRKTKADESPPVGGLTEEGSGASEAAPSAPYGSAEGRIGDAFGVGDDSSTQSVFKGSLREDAPSEQQTDPAGPQHAGRSDDDSEASSVAAGFGFSEGASSSAEAGEEGGRDYLDDLRRVQAEFENFRKRTFRERQSAEARGKRVIVDHLLPVLDNFERAIAHGEGGAGVQLVFKELKSALEREGLAEIPAEGTAFDPQVHEAVESIEDADVEHAMVTSVYRPGYTFAGVVIRPAMVVVARPPEDDATSEDEDVAEGSG